MSCSNSRVLDQGFYGIQAALNLAYFFQRQHHPFFKQTGAHGRYRLVQDINQRHAFGVLRKYQFQVAHRKFIEPHVAVFFQARNGADVADFVVLGFGEVMQNAAGRNNGLLVMPSMPKPLSEAVPNCRVSDS